MTLKEFIVNLTKLMEEKAAYASLNVITATDEEGNGFTPVYFTPSVGCFTRDKEFIQDKEELEEHDGIINAVCVN